MYKIRYMYTNSHCEQSALSLPNGQTNTRAACQCRFAALPLLTNAGRGLGVQKLAMESIQYVALVDLFELWRRRKLIRWKGKSRRFG